MPWRLQSEPTTVEKIVAGASYLTAGIVGIVYMLFAKGAAQSQQFRFHTFQSILLTLILMLFGWGSSFFLTLLVPLLSLAGPQIGGSLTMGCVTLFDLLSKAFYLLLIYGAVMAFLGKFAEVPYISNVVRYNMRA